MRTILSRLGVGIMAAIIGSYIAIRMFAPLTPAIPGDCDPALDQNCHYEIVTFHGK